jgi:hypothetical protein
MGRRPGWLPGQKILRSSPKRWKNVWVMPDWGQMIYIVFDNIPYSH